MAGNLTAMIASIFSGGVTPDPYYEYTTLLLPGNGTNGAQNNTFLDGSTNNFTITRNGNTTQGTFSPFSQTGWGGAFNTSTTYLTVTDTANLRFGSSNFTIEAWVYRSASGATQTIASKGAATPTGWVFQISSADKLVFTDTSTSITGTTSIAANTWTYVAVVRAGTGTNQTTLYVNGTSDGTGTSATNFNQTSNMLVGADRSTTNFANGYISNLRLSNTNRTISSTPTTALTADSNTIFLSLNLNRFQYTDSTAAYTNISVTGTPSVVAFSPFNPTASWSAATYGGSGYFDGNGDYLTAPSNAAFQLGSQDFTVELSIYINAFDSSGTWFVGPWGNTSGTNRGWVFAYVAGGTGVVFNYSTNGTNSVQTQSSTTLLTKTWYHFAAVRNGNTLTIYQNGQSIASSSMTGVTIYANTNDVYIGRNPEDIVQVFQTNGYISNMRIVKGVAVYTGNFTPPTAPLTAITNTSLLLNFTNAGVYDATSKNDLETVGNAQISTTQSKFGGSSMSFDGTGDYLIGPANKLYEIGSGAFTVEAWVYASSYSSVQILTSYEAASGTSYGIFSWAVYFNLGKIGFDSSTGSASNYGIESITNVPTNSWVHVAFTRSGNTGRLFINGNLDASSNNFTTTPYLPAAPLVCVGGAPRGYSFNGYIQDLRVTKGYARYTANFTPPTAAFPTL